MISPPLARFPMSAKYFGTIDVVGATITFGLDYILEIAGIAKKPSCVRF